MDFKSFKSGFFDRPAVLKALDRAVAKNLKEFGRLVRKAAQKSLKYKDTPSAPGSPPHVHKTQSRTRTSRSTGKTRTRRVSPLRDSLFFAYDADRRSVVIGPARLGDTADPGAPARLEYGGTLRGDGRTIYANRGVGRDQTGRFTSQGRDAIVLEGTMVYRARPFMRPALEAEKKQLPRLWRNSVR